MCVCMHALCVLHVCTCMLHACYIVCWCACTRVVWICVPVWACVCVVCLYVCVLVCTCCLRVHTCVVCARTLCVCRAPVCILVCCVSIGDVCACMCSVSVCARLCGCVLLPAALGTRESVISPGYGSTRGPEHVHSAHSTLHLPHTERDGGSPRTGPLSPTRTATVTETRRSPSFLRGKPRL